MRGTSLKKRHCVLFIEQFDERLFEFYADLKTNKAPMTSALFVRNTT